MNFWPELTGRYYKDFIFLQKIFTFYLKYVTISKDLGAIYDFLR